MKKKQSLTAAATGTAIAEAPEQGGTLVPSGMERIYAPVPAMAKPIGSNEGSGNYLTGYFAMNAKAGDQSAAMPGIQEWEYILCTPAGFKRLGFDFNCHFVNGFQCWTTRRIADGQLTAASVDPDDIGDCEEEIIAVLILHDGDDRIPATAVLRKSRAPAGKAGMNGVLAAAQPDWADKSEAHRIAAGLISVPWGRVTLEVTSAPRTSRATGKVYYVSSGKARPIQVDEASIMQRFIKDEEFNKLLDQTYTAYEKKVKEVTDKAKA